MVATLSVKRKIVTPGSAQLRLSATSAEYCTTIINDKLFTLMSGRMFGFN